MIFPGRVFQRPLEDLLKISKYACWIRHQFLAMSTNFHWIWRKNRHFIQGWPIPLSYHMSKNDLFRHKKGKKKKRCVTLWLVLWCIEWDKIFAPITYVEKLDRFTKFTSNDALDNIRYATTNTILDLESVLKLF